MFQLARAGLVLSAVLLLGCRHNGDVRYVQVRPQPYRGPVPTPDPAPASDDSTGTLTVAVFDCDGTSISQVQVAAVAAHAPSDTVWAAGGPSGFVLGPVRADTWQLRVRSAGYRGWAGPAELRPGRTDTLWLRLSPSPVAFVDCMCKDGKGFGNYCCLPRTVELCEEAAGAVTVREAREPARRARRPN
jgi:hypothetical protein